MDDRGPAVAQDQPFPAQGVCARHGAVRVARAGFPAAAVEEGRGRARAAPGAVCAGPVSSGFGRAHASPPKEEIRLAFTHSG
ncbi:hypothetical protein GCM10009602_32820 [Nocardiopsis tropica]